MGWWDRSLLLCKYLCDHGKQRMRHLAQQTGFAKSRVQRLQQAMAGRTRPPESWFWETEDGRQWLTRLVVATLYTCGLKRGVGVETLSEFVARLRVHTPGGCSPTALRGVMQTLEALLREIVHAWEQEGTAHGAVRKSIGAVDEPFVEQMMRVFLDVPTGSMGLEATAKERRYTTWKALVAERLKALGTRVLSLVRERAQAFLPLAEQG